MKVKIKNYVKQHSIRQVVIFILGHFTKMNFNKIISIADKIDNTVFGKIYNKINEKIYNYRESKRVSVILHNYDAWNVDSTVSFIVLPLLLLYRNNHGGHPLVLDCDVPDDMALRTRREISAKSDDQSLLTVDGVFSEERWNWVLDEMIYAFKSINDGTYNNAGWTDSGDEVPNYQRDYNHEEAVKIYARVRNGTRLFGVYLLSIWD